MPSKPKDNLQACRLRVFNVKNDELLTDVVLEGKKLPNISTLKELPEGVGIKGVVKGVRKWMDRIFNGDVYDVFVKPEHSSI